MKTPLRLAAVLGTAAACTAALTGCSSSSSTTSAASASTSASGAPRRQRPRRRPSSAAPAASFPVTVTAANGQVTIPAEPARIVSLDPTSTEDLYAVGAGKQVVAVDQYSDYPAGVPKTSLSGLTPNLEAIAKYNPSLVVASQDSGGLVAGLKKLGIPVLIEPAAATLSAAYAQIEQIGQATGHGAAAASVVAGMRQQIAAAGLEGRLGPQGPDLLLGAEREPVLLGRPRARSSARLSACSGSRTSPTRRASPPTAAIRSCRRSTSSPPSRGSSSSRTTRRRTAGRARPSSPSAPAGPASPRSGTTRSSGSTTTSPRAGGRACRSSSRRSPRRSSRRRSDDPGAREGGVRKLTALGAAAALLVVAALVAAFVGAADLNPLDDRRRAARPGRCRSCTCTSGLVAARPGGAVPDPAAAGGARRARRRRARPGGRRLPGRVPQPACRLGHARRVRRRGPRRDAGDRLPGRRGPAGRARRRVRRLADRGRGRLRHRHGGRQAHRPRRRRGHAAARRDRRGQLPHRRADVPAAAVRVRHPGGLQLAARLAVGRVLDAGDDDPAVRRGQLGRHPAARQAPRRAVRRRRGGADARPAAGHGRG